MSVVAVLAAATALAACGTSSPAAGGGGSTELSSQSGGVTLSVGDQNETLQLPLQLSGQGSGAPYNLDFTTFSDGPDMNAAFAANRIDVGMEGDSPVLLNAAGGSNVKVVAVEAEKPDAEFQVIARPGSGITSVADLRGKSVAVSVGTALQGYLDQVLATAHLTQSDIDVVNVPPTALVTALQSGSVDAAVLSTTLTASYRATNPGAIGLDAPSVTPYLMMVATDTALANPALRAAIANFVAREAAAGRWIVVHPNAWINADLVQLNHETTTEAKTLFDSTGYPVWTGPTTASVAHQVQQATLLAAAGELPNVGNPASFVAAQFDPALTAVIVRAIEQREG